MHKLIPVEEAKSLMTEAQDWSMWSWLMEKRRLRTAADRAWEALEEAEIKVRSSWSEELQAAFGALQERAAGNGKGRGRRPAGLSEELRAALEHWKDEADLAHAARMDAEEVFDQAERRMNTTMACEGARKAIAAWQMRETVIRKAEALRRKSCEA